MNDSTWTRVSGSSTINAIGVYEVKGSPSTNNHPGARYYAAGWYDSVRQEFWLFGGQGNANTSTIGPYGQSIHQANN